MVALANGVTIAAATNGRENTASHFGPLFQGMAAELKASNSAWEHCCSRATKLAANLQTTASALAHFVEALQTVSDSANNVNGISRDIGAALTRYCIRQRTIESGLREMGQTLQLQFAADLEKKSGEWKQTVTEAERRHQRTCKRLKQKPKQMEAESRNAFVELLHSQRNQFVGFISSLLPAINAQLSLLDEGSHVREVRNSMEAALNENEAHSLVQALLEDISCCNRPSSNGTKSNGKSVGTKTTARTTTEEQMAWDQRVGLGLASARAKSASQLRLNGPIAEMGTTISGQNRDQRQEENGGGGGGSGDAYSQLYRNSMPPPSTSTSMLGSQLCWGDVPSPSPFPPSTNGTLNSSPNGMMDSHHRPNTIASNGPGPFRHHHRPPLPEAFLGSSNGYCVKSAQNSPTKQQQQRRPTMLMDSSGNYSTVQFRPNYAPPIVGTSASAPQSTGGGPSSSCSMQTLNSSIHSEIGTNNIQHQPNLKTPPPPPPHQHLAQIGQFGTIQQQQQQQQRPLSLGAAAASAIDSVDGSATTSSSSAALIAETLQQIDRLGFELDNYCNGLDDTTAHQPQDGINQQGNLNKNIGTYGHFGGVAPQQKGHPHSQPATASSQMASAAVPAGVRMRPDMLIGQQRRHPQPQPLAPPPPPLPERRNSAISSATPTAPSIAEIRLAAGALTRNIPQQAQQQMTNSYGHPAPLPPPPPPPIAHRHPATPMAPSFIPFQGIRNSHQNQFQQGGK